MLGCCLLSQFGFMACNFSSPLLFPPSLYHSFSHISLLFLSLCFFCITVSVTLRYGYYGDSRILLGPASSRLIKANSVFVKQLQVSNKDNNQVILHAFNEKPQLSSQTNWTISNFFLVEAYKSKGISLWLNQGSTISMRWEAHTTNCLDQLHGMMIKGEKKFELLQAKTSFPHAIALRQTVNGKEAEYLIEEDDSYHLGVLNMNGGNIILDMEVNVSAKVYETTNAKKTCSTTKGSCTLSFVFPNTHYIILTATSNGDDGSYVEITLVARVLAYLLLLGLFMIVVYLILRYLGVYNGGDHNSRATVDVTYRTSNVIATQTETEPLMLVEANERSYGTNAKEDDDDQDSGASSSSSEELYDEKLCSICYDEQRNSFFVPCGHCATCYDCAQRIVDGESKVCPICRRLIHKARRLFHN